MSEGTMLSDRPAAKVAAGGAEKGIAAIGALTGFGALFAAASCCVLPLAFGALGIGAGLSGIFVTLTPLRWPLAILAVLAIASGWWSYLSRRRIASRAGATCAKTAPRRTTFVTLSAATILVVIALSWGLFEAPLMNLFA